MPEYSKSLPENDPAIGLLKQCYGEEFLTGAEISKDGNNSIRIILKSGSLEKMILLSEAPWTGILVQAKNPLIITFGRNGYELHKYIITENSESSDS